MHIIENDQLRVTVSDHGAELTGIFDKKNNREVIWNADPAYWKRHAPVLFPNVGRYYEDHCLIGGKTYTSGQHGFARDMEFVCTEETENSVTHLLEATEETKKIWPYVFQLYITHTLNDRDLTVIWKVVNNDQETMYFTIGGHPAFRFAKPEETKADYVLKVPGKEKLEYVLIDISCGCANVDEVHTLQLSEETYPLSDELFAKDALVVDNGQIEEAWLCHKDGTPYVGVRSEGFPNYGIWSVEGAPFVCLEPWMGRCDNAGFNAELSEKPNVNKVEAGEKFIKDYTIVVA